jgi:hypothetical protein
MMDWKTPALTDLETLQKCAATNGFLANVYGAANCVLYAKKFGAQIAVEGGWLFLRLYEDQKPRFFFPHKIEGGLDGAEEALKLLEKEARGFLEADSRFEKEPFVLKNITAAEKEIAARVFPGAQFAAARESGDYIYRTEDLAGLAGKKYGKKRNHIKQFKTKRPGWRFEPLTSANLQDARLVEEKWLEEVLAANAAGANSAAGDDLKIEKEIIFSALENFERFEKVCGMTGGLLYVDDKPAAFCVASLLSAAVTDVHFEKCLSPYARDGGYAVINNEFSKSVKTEFINREEDLGIEGLRKAKLSYYPEEILEKFNGTIHSA